MRLHRPFRRERELNRISDLRRICITNQRQLNNRVRTVNRIRAIWSGGLNGDGQERDQDEGRTWFPRVRMGRTFIWIVTNRSHTDSIGQTDRQTETWNEDHFDRSAFSFFFVFLFRRLRKWTTQIQFNFLRLSHGRGFCQLNLILKALSIVSWMCILADKWSNPREQARVGPIEGECLLWPVIGHFSLGRFGRQIEQ